LKKVKTLIEKKLNVMQANSTSLTAGQQASVNVTVSANVEQQLNSIAEPTVNLLGKITRVYSKNRAVFWVWLVNMQQEFKCVIPDSFARGCPIDVDDSIAGPVRMKKTAYGTELVLACSPLVTLGQDEEMVIRIFRRVLRGMKFGNKKATEAYESLKNIRPTGPEICAYLDEIAQSYDRYKDDGSFTSIGHIFTDSQARKLLNWWHKSRNKRRLYLLGLYNKDINKCHLSCTEMYARCLANPFTIVELQVERCIDILKRLNKDYTQDDVMKAVLARFIYDKMINYSWTSVPLKDIAASFPDVMTYLKPMMDEYGVKGKFRSLYLEYPYMAERRVSEEIGKLIDKQSTFSTKNKPITFFRETLNSEQQSAITGCLNSSVSVITGGAGTGKTTIIGEIISNLEQADVTYMVGSFTGKAVSRLREVVRGRAPATLNRLISRAAGVPEFQVLIIDEASMVTTDLMYEFGAQFNWGFDIIFVGDINQLQPIGWGCLFEQVIQSQQIPVFKLKTNMRSDAQGANGIIHNS
jgi:hypothetical protein